MKITSNFRQLFRRSGEGMRHSAERDWLIILATFVFVLIFISAYTTYFYHQVLRGAFYGTGTVAQNSGVSLDTKRLDHVMTLIDEREKWRETMLSQFSQIVDPSQ